MAYMPTPVLQPVAKFMLLVDEETVRLADLASQDGTFGRTRAHGLVNASSQVGTRQQTLLRTGPHFIS